MNDVLGQIVLGRSDEALDALEVPGAVGLRDGPSPARAHIGAGVRLGEDHGRGPASVDHDLCDSLVAIGPIGPQNIGEFGTRGVHVDRGIGADVELVDRPLDRRRSRLPTELDWQLQLPISGVDQSPVRLLE